MTKYSLYLSTAGADWAQTVDLANLAECLGYDTLWLMDNTAGWAGAPHQTPLFDPWAAIPALAAMTERISLGTLATPPGRRHPAILARQIATADQISDGRVQLTMGAGDEPQMYELMGQPLLPPRQRIDQMIEELTILQSLWSSDLTTFDGAYYQLEDGICEPKPARPIPMWIPLAWGHRRMPRVIAQHADGFSVAPHLAPRSMVETQLANVEAACEAIGRDFSTLSSNRLVGVTLFDDDVDVPEARRRLLAESHPRTRQVMDAAGQYWRDILHRQWPDAIPANYSFEDFYDTSEFHCIGSPRQVADQIEHGVVSLGIDEIVVWPHGMLRSWEDVNVANQRELAERFADQVVPLLERASNA